MICRSCGTQLPEGSGFCTNCGKRVEPVQTPPQGMHMDFTPNAVTAAQGMHMDFSANAAPAPQGMNFDFNTNTAAPAQTPRFYEYKVLTQKDKWFSGKFDPAVLEQALNAYAQQGWRVIGCATADIPGFGVARQEFVTILERKR